MSNSMATIHEESYPMNGGVGSYSYANNSSFQKAATNVANSMIDDVIVQKLDIRKVCSKQTNTFCIADLGCSVGPNTFIAMQNIISSIQNKYQSQGLASQIPEFQVFFNDHASNDFNTLFTSLPLERNYFAAGMPGSFHGRLFPKASINFVHSSYAIQWLSKVPEDLLDKNSSAWNRGRIHYTSAPVEVVDAYSAQFSKDKSSFFDARANEIVSGGVMVLIMPGIADDVPMSRLSSGVMFDLLGSSLMDIAKKGLISEAQVDSFNIPVYNVSPKEMTQLIERNGCFSVETMELTNPKSRIKGQVTAQACTMHLRAGFEGIISKHFGSGIIDEVFNTYYKKYDEFSHLIEASFEEPSQLFIVLKRK